MAEHGPGVPGAGAVHDRDHDLEMALVIIDTWTMICVQFFSSKLICISYIIDFSNMRF